MPETRNQPETDLDSDSVPAQTKPTIGRPTKYSDKLAIEICTQIAHGVPLTKICKQEGMPVLSSVYLWLSQNKNFSDMYTKAREDQADTLADEIQAIADQMPMEKTDKEGNTSFDSAYIQWMRLRVDARKWVAAKLKPKKYGDRVELAGDRDNPIQIEAQVQAKELFDSLLTNMELKKQEAK